MSDQDALRQQLFDALDDVEATANRLTGDKSQEAIAGQTTIVDIVNDLRQTVGTIPEPSVASEEDGAAANEPDEA